MTGPAVTLNRGVAVAAAFGLLAVGAAATFVATRWSATKDASTAMAGVVPAATAAPPDVPASMAAVRVQISPELLARSPIATASVGRRRLTTALRLPGIVTANAYRQTVVTPLAGGRVEDVGVELGDTVRRGQVLARVHSPMIAEARAGVVAARSTLTAHEREVRRLEQLRDIGAASQQDVEWAHAEHASHLAGVESAVSRLALFEAEGGTEAGSSTYLVRAPSAGVVTERTANPGLNVDPAMPLFTISDLSSVWVIADVYEQDLATLRVGQTARVVPGAYRDRVLTGHVSYIDPQMRQDTRTARIRIEVPNRGSDLRFGMFADIVLDRPSGAESVVVPRSAVHTIGDRAVVYIPIAGQPGAFHERGVHLGEAAGDEVAVVDGLVAGDTVVTSGGFFLRAEIERLGLRHRPVESDAPGAAPAPAEARPGDRVVSIAVTATGFEPARVPVAQGTAVTLVFTRTVEETCAKEVVFPALGIRRALPLGKPVTIALPPAAGEVAFTCGLNMLKGAVVVP